MKIIIPTSNAYVHMCQTCLNMLNVHWRPYRPDDEIVFLVYDNRPEILDYFASDRKIESNVRVVSLGNQSDYGNSWTKGIVNFLAEEPCEYFMLMLEDHLIHEMMPIVGKCESIIRDDLGVSKIELTSDPDKLSYQIKDDDFYIKHQDSRYRTSVLPSIWRTSYFLEYANKCTTAWDFEISGGEMAKNDGAQILAVRKNAVNVQNFLKKGKLQEVEFLFKPKMMSLICATRGRPEHFKTLLDSIKKNTIGSWELIVEVDADDPFLPMYDFKDDHVVVIAHHKKMKLCELYNHAAFSSRGDLIQMVADDCIFETFGWDKIIRNHIPGDEVFITSCFDGKKITSFHQCMSRKAINIIGYFYPPVLRSYYNDPWMEGIFKILNRVLSLPNIILRHNHDSISDETRINMEINKEFDKNIYRSFSYERMQAAYKLKEIMK